MNKTLFLNQLVVLIFITSFASFALGLEVQEKPIEKDKPDFGEVIKESTKEVKAAESNYSKTVKTKKYVPRRTKGKHKVKVNIPKETVEAQDNMQWDYNRKEALKQKKKLDGIEVIEPPPRK
jgi:phage anti-repressor protein